MARIEQKIISIEPMSTFGSKLIYGVHAVERIIGEEEINGVVYRFNSGKYSLLKEILFSVGNVSKSVRRSSKLAREAVEKLKAAYPTAEISKF